MESVRVVFHSSSSSVVRPAPLKHVQVIEITTSLHYQLQKVIGQDVAMFTILCQDVRETGLPIYIVKTTVLKMSCMNGFLEKDISKLQIESMGIRKIFERGFTICSAHYNLVDMYLVFYFCVCSFLLCKFRGF